MIINPASIDEKYECGRIIMEYLVYRCNIPILGFEGDRFYFAKTHKLEDSLKRMPFYLKILGGLIR